MAGEHSRLVITAQADTDTAHRQIAMDRLAALSPYAGGDNQQADAMAAAALVELYPPAPQPGTADKIRAIIAGYEQKARAAVRATAPGKDMTDV